MTYTFSCFQLNNRRKIMPRYLVSLLISIFLLWSVSALAVKGEHAHYVYSLTSGHPGQIRMASTQIYNAHISDTELMDIVMEVMLQNANKGDAYVDPLSWSAKALIGSGNPRYHTALMSIAEDGSVHKKLKKYAKKAAKSVGKPSGEQYVAGMVDLDKVKDEAVAARKEMTKNLKGQEGYESIGIVAPGMSATEVVARCGQPTSISSHITGKQFIPFNYKGSDTVRTYYLYKGQGTVVVANDSAWTAGTSVIEVQIDENEVGYR
jgi:hypothetical protein